MLCAGFWANPFLCSHLSCILFSILSGTFPFRLPNWHIVNLPGVLLPPIPRRHSWQRSSKHEGSIRRQVEGEGNGYQAYIINLSCRCLSRECRRSLVAPHTVRKAEIYGTQKGQSCTFNKKARDNKIRKKKQQKKTQRKIIYYPKMHRVTLK